MPPATSPGLAPGYEFGYDQITSGVNITGTSAGSPTTIITCAAHWFDGQPVMCEFFTVGAIADATTGDFLGVALWEGSTDLATIVFQRRAQTVTTDYQAISANYRFTPTAGMHTYLIRAYVSANNNASISAGAAGVNTAAPAYVRFVKI
jgi:hypothetical protein